MPSCILKKRRYEYELLYLSYKVELIYAVERAGDEKYLHGIIWKWTRHNNPQKSIIGTESWVLGGAGGAFGAGCAARSFSTFNQLLAQSPGYWVEQEVPLGQAVQLGPLL